MQLLGYSVIHFVVRTKSPLGTCFSSYLSAIYRRPSTSDHPLQCNFPRSRLFSEFNLFLILEKTNRLFFQTAIQIQCLENESSSTWFQASAALYMRSSLFWDVMKRRFVISYQSFVDWPLKMGPISCPETSVIYHQYTLHDIPEERRSQR